MFVSNIINYKYWKSCYWYFLVIAICVAEGIIVRKLERSSNIQIRRNAKWKRAAVFIIIFFFAFIGVALCLYFNLKNIY